jgi:hypothetical protein
LMFVVLFLWISSLITSSFNFKYCHVCHHCERYCLFRKCFPVDVYVFDYRQTLRL